MTHLPKAAHALLATQHGVASLDQLSATGLSPRQVEYLTARGDLVHVVRGAYRSASVQLNELGRCVALCLARKNVVICGPTAGRLWGFRKSSRDRRIHVLGSPASNPSAEFSVVAYRTAAIHSDDIVERQDGIRVTGRARTSFDLARHLSPADLQSVQEQAMHDGGLSVADLRSVAVDWISPQRRWVAVYLEQLDRRLSGGAAESDPEVRVGRALRDNGVTKLSRQFPIDLPGYGPARFDMAIPGLKWAIEVDVFPTHQQPSGEAADELRDAAAKSWGGKSAA